MVFASLAFIFMILPLFLAGDFLTRPAQATAWRNIWLIVASLLFYLWGEAYNVFLLLGLGLINYWAGRGLPGSRRPRLWLALFVAVNLGVLVGFKYAGWLAALLGLAWSGGGPSLPLGISFFTFHAISYLVDIYRRQIAPAGTALEFLTYFCMFPHLVAGPIVRYAQVSHDLGRRGPDRELFSFGFYRFLLGLNKKVLIANSVSVMADSAFTLSRTGHLQAPDAWLGVLAYTIQIYFDFSGYSDMAIGLAAMAGFRFEENFKRPYSSVSLRQFWRRWHISLSSWLRDYLYLPLGGSRRTLLITGRNLLLVFFLCGLWHGAETTFIVWGLWHGLFLLMERWGPVAERLEKLPVWLTRAYVWVVVLVGWVFFRAENMPAAITYLGNMFTFSLAPATLANYWAALTALAAGMFLCLLPDKYLPAPSSRQPGAYPASLYGVQAAFSVVSVAFLLTGARNPFIYFNF
jgi:alginate O-acetyltransferase complex protein AlgI